MSSVRITVYGCGRDEADAFARLGPRLGVVPTIVPTPVSAADVVGSGDRCVSVDHRTPVPRRVLTALAAAGVEHLSTRSIGVDHIDLGAAADVGITVENVVYAPDGVADHTLMLILMAVRGAAEVLRAADRQDFRLPGARGLDLCDLTVGVVGAGHVGTAVIRRLRGFGCRLLATDPGPGTPDGAALVGLRDLLRVSDVVTLHLPLTTTTRHLLGPEQIGWMKAGAVLVNTARGDLVDTAALLAALEAGRLGGAALDVLEGEEGTFSVDARTGPLDHPLLAHLQRRPDVIVTPHCAYFTERTLRETVEQTLSACVRFERRRAGGETQDRDLVRGLLGGT
ncbi:MAG TPA: NAD(P)-dependent oxidoreductase [Aquihabitans sp.]|jgi:D-specific alpha-keto acid dehydrogenase|nr:NAD(P)-dependent oxidoreductase [Aquihabitans sp.]